MKNEDDLVEKTWYMWNNITVSTFPKKDFSYFDSFSWYGVSTKKVLHVSEEKMHKKMKMTSQRAENFVHV